MPPDRQSPNATGGTHTTTDALAEPVRRDEARLLDDEARIAEDEHDLRTNRLVAGKLAPGAVGTDALLDGGVRRADLGARVVGHAQLRAGSVIGADVRRNALTGAQIDERTLRDVASAQTAVRPHAARDAQLLGGAAASAYLSRIMIGRAASTANQRRTKGAIAARRPAGMRIVSGGAAVDGTSHGVAIARSAPNGDQDWVAVANSYHRPTVPWRLVVTAVCVAGGAA